MKLPTRGDGAWILAPYRGTGPAFDRENDEPGAGMTVWEAGEGLPGPPPRAGFAARAHRDVGRGQECREEAILVAAMIEFNSFRLAHLIEPIAHGSINRMK